MHLNIRLSGDTANKPMGEPGMPVCADHNQIHQLSFDESYDSFVRLARDSDHPN
jgi:hypothetical protein